MEEVWNRIALSGQPTPAAAASAFSATIFQDFLSGPSNRDASSPGGGGRSHFLDSPAPPLTMAMSLNSASDFRSGSLNLKPSSFPDGGTGTKKSHDDLQNGESSSERFQRMMKNRESAARSRARKQAYTYQLEVAIGKLKQENARLRKQQVELLAASKRQRQRQSQVQVQFQFQFQAQPPNKQDLCRTLSAPF